MSTALAVPAAPLAKLVDRAREYAADGRAGSTIERAVTAIAQLRHSRGIDWPRSHPATISPVTGIGRS